MTRNRELSKSKNDKGFEFQYNTVTLISMYIIIIHKKCMLNTLRTMKYTILYTIRGVPLYPPLDANCLGEDGQKQPNASKNDAFGCYGIALVKNRYVHVNHTTTRCCVPVVKYLSSTKQKILEFQ